MKTIIPLILLLTIFFFSCQPEAGEFVCTPCDLPCDTISFSQAGMCPHCGMELIGKSELEAQKGLVPGEINIETGSGAFLIKGGKGNESKLITVYYHKPERYSPLSKVLLVVPGAGRDGDEYRDAWIEASEKHNVLVLSPAYPDSAYAFEDYHMGGVMSDLNLESSVEYVENTNVARLDEEKFTFKLRPDPEQWIFKDFDRIFELTVKALGSKQTTYDIFGHSAGGQILHRMTIFYPNTKANRILASNSGFYTLPDVSKKLPFGLKNTGIDGQDLSASFQKKLVLFIGELDNADETGGTLLRSESADQQGLHRLERGQYFYHTSQKTANELNAEFNWTLEIVPGIGHDQRKMARAAARYLYEKN